MKKKTVNRILSLAMALTVLIGILPVSAWAVDHVHDDACGYSEPVACKHAQGQHDDTCGYAAPSEGSGCNHSCGDGLCNYAAGTSGNPCSHSEGCPEMEPGTVCGHTDGCGYSEGTLEVPCDHARFCTSGGDCGYIAPSDGSPCTHETHNDACGYSEGSACNYAVAPIDNAEHTHVWSTEWSDDEWFHWHDCTADGCDLTASSNSQKDGFDWHKIINDTHAPGREGAHIGTCSICGREDSLNYKYTYTRNLYNDTYHWNECGCGVEESYGEHWFGDDADMTCDGCGYTRSVEGTLSITGDLPDATVGVAYSASFSYTGTVSGVVFWNATGLPEGMTIDAGSGVVTGTPTTAGTYQVTIAMGATGGGSASRNFTLTVREPTPAHTHVWSTEWSGNHWLHWHDCTADGCDLPADMGENKEGFEYHAFDFAVSIHNSYENSTTAIHKGTCVTCGEEEAVKRFETVTFDYDDTHHWRECSCGHTEYETRSTHLYTDDADTTCNEGHCGYVRTVGGGTTVDGVITLTPADLGNGNASGEGWSFDGNLTIQSGYRLIFDGECWYPVHNHGTIVSGTFGDYVYNHGTIEDGTFNLHVFNYGTIVSGSFNGLLSNDAGTIEGGSFDGEVTNYGTIKGGTFNHEVFNRYLISGGTFTKQVTNDGTIENGSFNFNVANNESGTIKDGSFSVQVENQGTIEGGNFSGSVNNNRNATISGGVFTGGLFNPGTVTGMADLSGLRALDNNNGNGRYGKDVKLPKVVIRGDLTYTGCDPTTQITLHYYADGVKTDEWKVSGEKYSYPVEKYKRTDPDADLSTIEEITHEVKAVSMEGYEITIDNPIWDRFHVTVTALHTHNFGTEWKSDGTNHWHECSCGAKSGEAAHSGGTQTCTEKAVCSTCGTPYGEVLGHDWGNWISNGDGTHTRTCANDANHTETDECSGGTATCTEKAKCTVCSTEYGNLVEHSYGTDWKFDNNNHWHECACSAKKDAAAHTGGEATCTEKAKCSVCGNSYGEKDSDNHSFTKYVSDKNATCKLNGTETAKCDHGCGKTHTRTDWGSKLGHNFVNGICTRCRLSQWNPDTGDKIMIAVTTLALSGAALLLLLVFRKKQRR